MKAGQKIEFIGVGCKESISWGGNVDPEGILENGKEYTVKKYEIRSWHTKLFLEEVKGQFNPLWFEPVGDTELLKKPPIGLVPKHIHDQNRIWEIVSAIHRYNSEGKETPKEWIEELDSLNRSTHDNKKIFRLSIYPDVDKNITGNKTFEFYTEKELVAAHETSTDLILFLYDDMEVMPDCSNAFLCEKFVDNEWVSFEIEE